MSISDIRDIVIIVAVLLLLIQWVWSCGWGMLRDSLGWGELGRDVQGLRDSDTRNFHDICALTQKLNVVAAEQGKVWVKDAGESYHMVAKPKA